MEFFIVFILGYLFLITYGFNLAFKESNFYEKATKSDILIFVGISAFFYLLVVSIITQEKCVYYWDYGSYWHMSNHLYKQLSNDTASNALSMLYNSICNDEYNILASLIIISPLKSLGGSYASFVLINFVLFYLPYSVVLTLILKKVCGQLSYNIKFNYLYLFVLAFFVNLFPVLCGYVDIIALLLYCLSLYLIIDRKFEKVEINKDLLLGTSVFLTLLLRRYFAYGVVGLLFFTVLYWSLYGFKGGKIYAIKVKLIDVLFTLIPIFISILLFWDFIKMSVFYNHAEAYSAYKTGDIFDNFIFLFKNLGLINCSMLIVSFVVGVVLKRFKFVISLFLSWIVTCVMFYRVQSFSPHHYYTVSTILLILIFIGVVYLIELVPLKFSLRQTEFSIVGVSFAVLYALNFAISVDLCGDNLKSKTSILWYEATYKSKVRTDMSVLKQMDNYLASLDEQGYKGLYCIASGHTLNDAILVNLTAPDYDWRYSILRVSHIDLRDGFLTSFFEANIIAVCENQPSNQFMIYGLADIMNSDNVFSNNYEMLDKEFELEYGVKVKFYRKKTPLSKEALEYVRDVIDAHFPNHPELFKNRIDEYMYENLPAEYNPECLWNDRFLERGIIPIAKDIIAPKGNAGEIKGRDSFFNPEITLSSSKKYIIEVTCRREKGELDLNVGAKLNDGVPDLNVWDFMTEYSILGKIKSSDGKIWERRRYEYVPREGGTSGRLYFQIDQPHASNACVWYVSDIVWKEQ